MGAISQAKKAGITPGGPMSGIGMMKNLGGGMASKPGVVKPGKFNSAANKAKRAKFKSHVGEFAGGLGKSVKQLGTQISSGGKKVISNVRSGKPLTASTFMGKGGGKIKAAADKKFKAKTRKSSGPKPVGIFGGFKKSVLSPTVSGMQTLKLKATKGGLYKPGKTKTTTVKGVKATKGVKASKGVKATTANTKGILRASKNKKTPAYKPFDTSKFYKS